MPFKIDMQKSELSYAEPSYTFTCVECLRELVIPMNKDSDEPIDKLRDHGWMLYEARGVMCGSCKPHVYADTCPVCAREQGWLCRDKDDQILSIPHPERFRNAFNERHAG